MVVFRNRRLTNGRKLAPTSKGLWLLAVQVAVLLLLAQTASVRDAAARQSLSEGFVLSPRSLFVEPDVSSEKIGTLNLGDFVRIERVHSVVYRVFVQGEEEAVGYVVYPKLGEEPPAQTNPASSGTPVESVAMRDAEPPQLRWVHALVNIRSAASARSEVVAQLPPGARIMVGGQDGRWLLAYKPNETVFEPQRALGYVHESLIRDEAPTREVNPLALTPDENQEPQTPTDLSVVNVNTATLADLEALPRIGPVLAERIFVYRENNGPFARIEDLARVKGIGAKTIERLRPYVSVK